MDFQTVIIIIFEKDQPKVESTENKQLLPNMQHKSNEWLGDPPYENWNIWNFYLLEREFILSALPNLFLIKWANSLGLDMTDLNIIEKKF